MPMLVTRQERTLAIDGVYIHVCITISVMFVLLIVISDNAINK